MHDTLTVGSCFAGIGGIDLGLEASGDFRTVWHSEVRPSAGRVLADKFPSAQPLGDITTLFDGLFGDPTPVDVITGGPPCQDISKANAHGRRGLAGLHSRLFANYAELVGDLRPRWLVMEQVTGLLTSNDGRDYETVLETWEALGYVVEVVAQNSLAYVAQSRSRLYFVGSRETGAAARALLPIREDGASDPRTYRASTWTRSRGVENGAGIYRKSRRPQSELDGETWVASDYANTLTLNDVGESRATVLVVDDYGVRILTPVEWERCHGFPDDWTIAAGTDAERYALLGNAVSPPVAQRIGTGILACESAAAR